MTEGSNRIQKLKERNRLKVQPSFKKEILKMPEAKTLKICFQCGTCTATCPIARFTNIFRPNKLIHMARLGFKERTLKGKTVWLCSTCYECDERCPQGVKVKELMRIFKNLAVKNGYIPQFYITASKNLLEKGLIYNIPESRLKMRERLSLPPLPEVKSEDIKKLASSTGYLILLEDAKK